MKKVTLLLILIPILSKAQVNEDFESGTIAGWQESTPGRWNTSDENPIAGTYSLRHIFDNPAAGHDQISYPIYNIALDSASTTWQFKVRYDYTPSGANNWSVFLVSDQNSSQMYPSGEASGFAVGVNYSGTDDVVKLWEISSGSASEIINTGFNWQDNINRGEVIGIQVCRTDYGSWDIMIDTTGTFNDFYTIGSGVNSGRTNFHHFGIYYEYTSSQDRKLWIDDITIEGHVIIDTIKPFVTDIHVPTSSTLEVIFSEPVDPATATDPLNYSINGSIGQPLSVDLSTQESVIITASLEFIEETEYLITIENIKDRFNNSMITQIVDFSYYRIRTHDILISEIMADPIPSIELPEHEYIEIFNSTTYHVLLQGWTLQVGHSIQILDRIELPALGYLILCPDNACGDFESYGLVKGIPGFPALLNSGQSITLRNERAVIISSVSYSDEWYKDEYKADGGWSLEQIDPNNPCGGEKNWEASIDKKGGTPGEQNSLFGENPDLEGPLLLNAYILSDSSLSLHFNEPIDSISAQNPDQYSVDNGIGTPEKIHLVPPLYESVELLFQEHFHQDMIYKVTIGTQLTDCAGNTVDAMFSRNFGYPQRVDSFDVILNEILFNPFLGGVDYVEVFNRSDKILDFNDLLLGSRDIETGSLKTIYPVTHTPLLFFPGEYFVFSQSARKVLEQYYSPNPYGFIDMVKMPSYPNEKGRVLLADKSLQVIDEFMYDEEMHYPLLRSVDGVSLERISPINRTTDRRNWHSASEDCGYGTPAYENSQHIESDKTEDQKVRIEPEVFSPNNDGYHDVVQIHYQFTQPGYVASITVFDARGRIVRKLVLNELLGIEGSFTWNGLNDENRIPGMGIYLVFIEVFDLKGNVNYFKKTCVLAKKLMP